MKRTLLLIPFFLEVILTFSQYPPYNPDYKMVFDDEFNYDDSVKSDSLSNKWNSGWPWNQTSTQMCEWCSFLVNHTLSNYNMLGYRTHEFRNCELDSGILKVISKKEKYKYPGKVWDSWKGSLPVETTEEFDYTTGMLMSKQNFRFGYFEIRCRLPKPSRPHATMGLGPNFWLFGANDTCSHSELDIFEFAGEDINDGVINKHTSNVHYRKMAGKDCYGCTTEDTTMFDDQVSYGSCDFSDFHTFGAEWLPEKIVFYKDGKIIHVSTNHPDSLIAMPVIIDINHPSSNFCSFIDRDLTKFPYAYLIDYIRIYQLTKGYKNN